MFDILKGDLVTKNDLAMVLEKIDSRFSKVDARFVELESRMDKRFAEVDKRFAEFELRITTRLGLLTVSSVTVAVTILSWLIKTN